MKSYVELPCDNIDIISEKIYQFLSIDDLNVGWNFVNAKELLKAVPELVDFFKKYKLYVQHASVTKTIDDQTLPLHLDIPPVVAKINFPVINTQGWINQWYAINYDIINTCPLVEDQFGKLKCDLSTVDKKDLILISELFDMPKPIVFNSGIPHRVVNYSATKFPRVVASFTFLNEPLGMLQ
jgi:hypothetical protein